MAEVLVWQRCWYGRCVGMVDVVVKLLSNGCCYDDGGLRLSQNTLHAYTYEKQCEF